MDLNIVPYRPVYEAPLLELESASPQGRHIRLEMRRDHVLDRSEVFREFGIFLALSGNGDLLGVVAGSTVDLERNGKREAVGFVYDLRVSPPFRRKGIAQSLGTHLIQEYFGPLGVKHYITTLKAGNRPAFRALQGMLGTSNYYPFSYLTIPTGMRVGKVSSPAVDSRFGVSAFGFEDSGEWIYRHPDGSPALFRTDLTYRVKAISISPWLKYGMRALEIFKKTDWKLPGLGEEVCFATAFDLVPEEVPLLNQLLEHLQQLGIQYLAVCCLRGDYYYRNLRSLAINSLDYRVLGTLPLKASDSLTLDVRCL